MIDKSTIARLAELCERTEGPWEARHIGYGHSHEVVRLPSGAPDDGGDIICSGYGRRDIEFIAAARTALPDLLADRAALLDAVRMLRDALSLCKGRLDTLLTTDIAEGSDNDAVSEADAALAATAWADNS